MEEIKEYGDLSESELYEFLHIIESNDDDLAEAEKASEQIIEDEEDCLPDEMLDDAWTYKRRWVETEDGRYKAEFDLVLKSDEEKYWEERRLQAQQERIEKSKKALQAQQERRKERKLRKTEIHRAAFRQDSILLSDGIPKDVLTQLITDLVSEHAIMMEKLHTFINKRITMLLSPLIPRNLRTCAKEYPHSVMKCPGFMYKGSVEYGGEKYFWATPDIPYYFLQGTEQEVLKSIRRYSWLYSVDKAVANYNYHKTALSNKEVKYATTLVRNNVRTYIDLLKYNPFWFERLYRIITQEELCTTNY